MNDFAPILPPDTPDDWYALPYDQRRAAKVLPVNATQRKSLKEAGLITLLDVDVWISRGGEWTSLPGVGKVTGEKIAAAYESLQSAKKWEILRGD